MRIEKRKKEHVKNEEMNARTRRKNGSDERRKKTLFAERQKWSLNEYSKTTKLTCWFFGFFGFHNGFFCLFLHFYATFRREFELNEKHVNGATNKDQRRLKNRVAFEQINSFGCVFCCWWISLFDHFDARPPIDLKCKIISFDRALNIHLSRWAKRKYSFEYEQRSQFNVNLNGDAMFAPQFEWYDGLRESIVFKWIW